MMESLFFRCAIFGFVLIGGAIAYGYEGYPAGMSGDYIYPDVDPFRGDNTPPVVVDKFYTELVKYNSTLTSLFGSRELVESLVYEAARSRKTNFWVVDQIRYEISSRLDAQNAQISAHDRSQLEELLAIVDKEIKLLADHSAKAVVYELLNHTRANLDCAIGHRAVNEHYSPITFPLGDNYMCSDEIPNLWRALLNGTYNEQCTMVDSIMSLDCVNQAAKSKKACNTSSETMRVKVKLINLISTNYDYLKHVLCPDTYQQGSCPTLDDAICSANPTQGISSLAQRVQEGLKQHPPKSSSDMMKLLNVQSSLADISSSLVSLPGKHQMDFAKDMLDTYVGMVDTTIGKSSVEVWKQTPQSSSDDVFRDVLVNSEKYVGQFSKLILQQTRQSDEVDKPAMSVKMAKYGKDDNDTVAFSFTGAEVWTQPFKDADTGHVYVYALHYNSWRETVQEIAGNNSNTTSDLKFFAGEGGIISLSTVSDSAKHSVPVTYKMNFAADVKEQSGDTKRHCLSCEYLDTETNQWLSTGCHVTGADQQGVTCHCNHTTNFAAFMMPYDPEYNTTEQQEAWMNVAEYIGSVLSVIGLVISFIAFCLVRESVRNDRLKAHMNLVVALLFVHLIQLGTDFAVQSNDLCVATTIATHFFLLSAFMWMLVEGIFLYLYVVQVFVHSKLESRWWMYAIGWLVPVVVVAISAGYGIPNDVYIQPAKQVDPCEAGQFLYPPINTSDLPKYASCWLDAQSGMTWSFIGPALAVIAFNLVILCKVIQVLVKLSERSKGMQAFSTKHQLGSQSQGYSNTAYRPKMKQAAKVTEYRTTASEHFSSSITEGDDSALHGSALPSSRCQSQSRSPSQVYLQNRVMERPRMTSSAAGTDRNFLADARTAVKGAIVLLPLLGIPWICGMFGYKSFALAVIFVVFNSVQGVAIFLVYCVFNHEVRRGLQRHLQLYRINRDPTGRGRTASTSSLKSAFNRGLLRSWRRRSTAVSTLSNHV